MKLTCIYMLLTVFLFCGTTNSYGQFAAARKALSSVGKAFKSIGKSTKSVSKTTKSVEKTTKAAGASKIKVIKKGTKEFLQDGGDVFEIIPCPECYGTKTVKKMVRYTNAQNV